MRIPTADGLSEGGTREVVSEMMFGVTVNLIRLISMSRIV